MDRPGCRVHRKTASAPPISLLRTAAWTGRRRDREVGTLSPRREPATATDTAQNVPPRLVDPGESRIVAEEAAFAPVAQRIEHRFPKPGVARSSRAGGARDFNNLHASSVPADPLLCADSVREAQWRTIG